jgi:hypothetical protein
MKTNRYNRQSIARVVKLVAFSLVVAMVMSVGLPMDSHAELSESTAANDDQAGQRHSEPRAIAYLGQMLDFIGNGPAFESKIRETVWTAGREVKGVGTYEQAGGGSGQFNLHITMFDGDGKHQLHQISDGKLAWTRSEIDGEVSLRRVDVGRLEEWVRGAVAPDELSPKLKVGAWGEMLDTLRSDFFVRLDTAKLVTEPAQPAQPMRVLIGDLKPARRQEILNESGRTEWPMLYPTRMHVAVRATMDPQTGLGPYVPARIEFWSDPVASIDASGNAKPQRRMIALIELYAMHPIEPPPAERFRFENQDAEVNFVNETDRYLKSYGINLTQGQRRELYR